MEDAVKIIGPLVGAFVGAISALALQGRQHRHDLRIQFHREQYDRYAAFTDAINAYVAARVSEPDPTSSAAIATHGRFVSDFEKLRLCASDGAMKVIDKIHHFILKLDGQPAISSADRDEINKLIAEFITIARQDLGSTKTEDLFA